MSKTLNKKEKMLSALEKSLGIVTSAAKTVGIDRSTHYAWMETDLEYKKQVENILNITIDFVENALLKKIKTGDITAIIFYLKTKGKRNGYSETSTLDLNLQTRNISDLKLPDYLKY